MCLWVTVSLCLPQAVAGPWWSLQPCAHGGPHRANWGHVLGGFVPCASGLAVQNVALWQVSPALSSPRDEGRG